MYLLFITDLKQILQIGGLLTYRILVYIFIWTIGGVFTIIEANSQTVGENKLIQGLEDQWLIYNAGYKGYIPYFSKEHGVQPTLSLYINLKKYSHYSLLLQTKQPTHLFIQSQLCRILPAQNKTILNIDSLQKQYKLSSLLITLYNPDGYSEPPIAQIIYTNEVKSDIKLDTEDNSLSATTKNSLQPRLRDLSEFPDFITVGLVFLLAFYTFLLNYHPKAFQRNFSFYDIFSVDTREDATLIAKPLSQINILFILAHSMSLTLFYMIAQRYSESFFVNVLPMQLSDSFSSLFGYFAICTGLIWILLICKYFFVYAVGVVFGINNVASVHYYEYLLFSRIFFLVVVPLQFILMLSFPQWLIGLLKIVVVGLFIFNVIRVITISSVLNKITSFRNLYLFSYLCATELIPLLIGVKFLAK